MKKSNLPFASVSLVLAFTLLACAVSAQSAASTSLPTLLPNPTENPIHTLGQLVEVNGLTLALVDVEYPANHLLVIFAAKNTGLPMIFPYFGEFSAIASDGTMLQSEDCTYALPNSVTNYYLPYFNGSLQPGENLRGGICWKDASPQSGIQVAYTPETQSKPAATWDVSTPGNVDVPAGLSANDFATQPHAQGETVLLNDVAATFNGLTSSDFPPRKNYFIRAHFILENKGTSNFKSNMFLANSFILKLPDGSSLSGGAFIGIVGCQNQAQVEILPGTKQDLIICYANTSSRPIAPGTLAIYKPDPNQDQEIEWVTK
jgi:hypothetical protein